MRNYIDKFVVRMPEGMRDAVESRAAEQHASMNAFVCQAIEEKLDRVQRAELAVKALVLVAGTEKREQEA